MKPYKDFSPEWIKEEAPKNSYRSIFRWGDPGFVKYPKESLYKMVKEKFEIDDEYFKEYKNDIGFDKVEITNPVNMKTEIIEKFQAICGKENVSTDDYDRVSVAYGKTMFDLFRLREKNFEFLPDVVIYPSSKEEIEKIVELATIEKIPVTVYGGGSSVTRGVECIKGGISLDMRRNFNKVVEFNEIDQTITVEAGMSGPKLEDMLNRAKELFGAERAYTCGHFPQSFEYSSVGGWVVTRGAGQNSTYYGKIEDICIYQEYATPIGKIKTDKYPRNATGPSIDHIMMGSEGAFGVLTHVTLRVFRFMPENRKRFSFMFKDWETAQKAAREMMQSEEGLPSVFRVSDAEETSLMMKLYGVDESPLRHLFKMRKMEDDKKCLFLGFSDGSKHFSKNVAKNVKKVCRKFGGMNLTGMVTKSWEHGRFTDPYLRDTMQDYGIMTDTLECSVNWSNMAEVHKNVRAYCKSRPNTIVTTHMSHVYPQGANLYFIFIAKMNDIEDYKAYHSGLMSAIQKSGAAMSHHHGIGKMFAPWLEGQIGTKEMGIYKTLKNYFDADNIMNPGGTLGIDLKEEEKFFTNGKV